MTDKEVAPVKQTMPSTEPEISNCMKSSEHVDKVHGGLNSTVSTHLLVVSTGMVSSIFQKKAEK